MPPPDAQKATKQNSGERELSNAEAAFWAGVPKLQGEVNAKQSS
jgi:hypothetical protein